MSGPERVRGSSEELSINQRMGKEMRFHKGDWVRVAKDLGPYMSHFTADCEAIVIGSYADQYGGMDEEDASYTLHLKGRGKCSWYYGSQLTLIEAGRIDKLQAWKEEQDAERKQKSDLDWIFSHGSDVLANPHGASIEALAKCFGLTNLWGRRGEGITYYSNAMGTLTAAEPFLSAGDKEGWLKKAKELMDNVEAKGPKQAPERNL